VHITVNIIVSFAIVSLPLVFLSRILGPVLGLGSLVFDLGVGSQVLVNNTDWRPICRLLAPGEFYGMTLESLPVYPESL